MAKPNKEYSVGKKIGEGNYGVIYTLWSSDQKKHLKKPRLRILKVRKTESAEASKESTILKKLFLGNEYNLATSPTQKTSNPVAVKMKFFGAHNLQTASAKLRKSNQKTLQLKIEIILQMVLQVCILHQLGYVHADIKPENFSIDKKYNVALVDYGLTKKLQSYSMSNKLGTPAFMDPKLLLNATSKNSKKTDMHSLSVSIIDFFSNTDIKQYFLNNIKTSQLKKEFIRLKKIRTNKLIKTIYKHSIYDNKDLFKIYILFYRLLNCKENNKLTSIQILEQLSNHYERAFPNPNLQLLKIKKESVSNIKTKKDEYPNYFKKTNEAAKK